MGLMLRPLLVLFVLLTALTGVVYPLIVTVMGRTFFAYQASGSLVMHDSKALGSKLIGQSFQDTKYFWSRLSATAPMPYNGASSGGSNLGPANAALIEAVRGRMDALRKADPGNVLPVPVDLVTASGSGLDPHESPAAALYQVARIARERGLDPVKLRELVLAQVEGPQWGVFGEPRVNVLLLNLALDRAQ